jgi:hypothetical protein
MANRRGDNIGGNSILAGQSAGQRENVVRAKIKQLARGETEQWSSASHR